MKIRYYINVKNDPPDCSEKPHKKEYRIVGHDYAETRNSTILYPNEPFDYIAFDNNIYDIYGYNYTKSTILNNSTLQNVINIYNLQLRSKKLNKI